MRSCYLFVLAFFAFASFPSFSSAQVVAPGQGCAELGATRMSVGNNELVACLLNTPNANARSCADGGGCTWVSMTGGRGGGECFTYYCGGGAGTPCVDHGGTQGFCPVADFRQVYFIGQWGFCTASNATGIYSAYSPPGGGCRPNRANDFDVGGRAYLCCRN